MRILISGFLFVAIMFCPIAFWGQTYSAYRGEIKSIVNAIKEARDLSYKYILTAEFPNGQKDRLKGELFVGNDDKLMVNDNDAFTLLYSNKWFYKADHRNKSITVVNLSKHLSKEFKQALEKDVFENNTLNRYLDSVVFKYAAIKNLKKDNDTIEMELSFPEQLPIKNMVIVYDQKAKIMVEYKIKTFQPWPSNEYGKDKGTTKVITCSGFKKNVNNKKYSSGSFFTVLSNNTLELNRYNKYKLNTQL